MYRHEETTPDKTRIRTEFFLLGALLGSVLLAFITSSPSVLLFGGLIIVAAGLWYFTGARGLAAPIRTFLAQRGIV